MWRQTFPIDMGNDSSNILGSAASLCVSYKKYRFILVTIEKMYDKDESHIRDFVLSWKYANELSLLR